HWGLLFVLAAVGILITRASQRGKVLLLWLNAGSVIMLAQAKIYDYHWLPMLPPLVILGGIAIERVLERVMHSPPHPPAPSPTQCGRPSFAGGRGAITRALSLSPFTWERDGLPKRSDASRVRGNLDIKVHNTLLERGDVNRLLRSGVSILITVLLLAILVNGIWSRALPYLTGQEDQITYYHHFQGGEFVADESQLMADFLRARVMPGD